MSMSRRERLRSFLQRYYKVVLFNAFLAVLLTLAALVGLEVYLRFSLPTSSGGSIFEFTLDCTLYKVMKKNTRVVAWGSELRTNSLGFRDNKDDVPPKLPEQFRIIVLGDSFTVSAGVDFDKIYTTVLERALNEKFRDVQIINMAGRRIQESDDSSEPGAVEVDSELLSPEMVNQIKNVQLMSDDFSKCRYFVAGLENDKIEKQQIVGLVQYLESSSIDITCWTEETMDYWSARSMHDAFYPTKTFKATLEWLGSEVKRS